MEQISNFEGTLADFEKHQVVVKPPASEYCYSGIDAQLSARADQCRMVIEGVYLRGGVSGPDSSEVIRREAARRPPPFRMSDELFQEYLRERRQRGDP